MKKVLLGSTALVAATTLASGDVFAAEKLKLGLGGYYEHTIGVVSRHYDKKFHANSTSLQSAGDGFESYQDAEVWFIGATTLDNGITISVQIELEANTAADQIDEAYMTISGNFGSFIIGSENLPNYKMHYSAPSVSRVGITSSDATLWFGQPTGAGGNTAISQFNTSYANDYNRFYANDALMVSYYTPRIAGFQLGIGFAPDSNEGNNNAGNTGGQFQNGISLGLNYMQNFDGWNIAASAGYIQWLETPATAGQPTAGLIRRDSDSAAYSGQFGLNLGWGGWTIGGAYAWTPYGATTTSTNSSKSWTAVYGARYITGPWGFSLNAMNTRAEGATPGSVAGNRNREAGADARMFRVEGAWNYQIGPGIQLHGSVMHQNERGELQGGDDLIGWMVTTGILVNF